MSPKSTIRVVEEEDQKRVAQRFVGLLCLVEFYPAFVCFGLPLWPMNGDSYSNPMWSGTTVDWAYIPLFAGTVVFFLCGRALWRGTGHEALWLWLGIIGLFAFVSLECAAAIIESMNSFDNLAAVGFGLTSESPTFDSLMSGLQAASVHAPLWVVIVIHWYLTRSSRHQQRMRAPLWVYCATAYCIASIPAVLFKNGLFRGTMDYAIAMLSGVANTQYVAVGVYFSILIVTGLFLYFGSRFARICVIAIATIQAVVVGYNWYILWLLINAANVALLAQIPFAFSATLPYTLTKHDFLWLFVLPAHFVAPWVIMAAFVRRTSLRQPPDDGTPFPRRYCAKCHYNLHGITTDVCPECGSDMSVAIAQESTATT